MPYPIHDGARGLAFGAGRVGSAKRAPGPAFSGARETEILQTTCHGPGALQCWQVNADGCSNHDTGLTLGEGHGRCSTR